MAQAAEFTGSIPQFYDRYLGPVIFFPYAEDLAARIQCPPGGRVLETACGTGIVTRRILNVLPSDARLVATDLNEPMIEHARSTLPRDERLEFRVADAMALPFDDATFDRVVCQFGVMFFPDKLAGAREAKRVLKRGGTYTFNVWDSFAHNPFGRITHETIASLFPTDPPAFYLTPFGYFDPASIRAALDQAGFSDIRVEHVARNSQAVSAASFAEGAVRGNPVLMMIEERGTVPVERVTEAVAGALAKELGEAPMRCPLRALVVTARA